MSFADYMKSVKTIFQKDDVTTDVMRAYGEMEVYIQPMYDLDKVPDFKGPVYDTTQVYFRRQLDKPNSNCFKVIADTLKQVLENEDDLKECIKEELGKGKTMVATDYYTINLLKYCEALTGFSDLARMWITAVTWQTLEKSIKEGPGLKVPPVINRDIMYLSMADNQISFCAMINMLSIPFKDFLKTIKPLKGHLYKDNDWDSKTPTTVTRKLDPFSSGFVNVAWNPAYHIGLAVNAWRNERNSRNKVELQQLQMMLLGLNEDLSATQDPDRTAKIQKSIDYWSNQANRISMEIEKYEGSN